MIRKKPEKQRKKSRTLSRFFSSSNRRSFFRSLTSSIIRNNSHLTKQIMYTQTFRLFATLYLFYNVFLSSFLQFRLHTYFEVYTNFAVKNVNSIENCMRKQMKIFHRNKSKFSSKMTPPKLINNLVKQTANSAFEY